LNFAGGPAFIVILKMDIEGLLNVL